MSTDAQAAERVAAPPGTRLWTAAWAVERLRAVSAAQALFFAYLVIALLLLTFFVPLFQKADEPAHFYRAVSITNLELACK